ncbi:hypothetical protein ACFL0Y_02330 [Patescibacteria group bacterium]
MMKKKVWVIFSLVLVLLLVFVPAAAAGKGNGKTPPGQAKRTEATPEPNKGQAKKTASTASEPAAPATSAAPAASADPAPTTASNESDDSDDPPHGNAHGHSKVAVCHKGEGDPPPMHTLWLPQPAVQAHLDHGDTSGECPKPDDPPVVDVCKDPTFHQGKVTSKEGPCVNNEKVITFFQKWWTVGTDGKTICESDTGSWTSTVACGDDDPDEPDDGDRGQITFLNPDVVLELYLKGVNPNLMSSTWLADSPAGDIFIYGASDPGTEIDVYYWHVNHSWLKLVTVTMPGPDQEVIIDLSEYDTVLDAWLSGAQ